MKTAGHCATETFGHRDRETQGLSDNDILGPVGIYMQAWQGRHDDLGNPAVAKILLNSREPLDRMGNMLISNFIKILVVF